MKISKKLFGVILLFVFCKPEPTEIEVYFSPEGGAEDAVIGEIVSAKREIDVAMYSFTNRRIAQALIDAKQRGVRVRVLVESGSLEDPFSKAKFLYSNGIDVKVYSSKEGGILHHKFAIYDGKRVTTGSFNWTSFAEHRNAEDLVLVKSKSIAQKYKKRFETLWQSKNTHEFTEEISLSIQSPIDAKDLFTLKKNSGKWRVVRGVVETVGYSKRSDTYFLNFGERGRCFTVVIFKKVVNRFRKLGIDIKKYEGKLVEVEGKIIDHPKYGLEIILDSPENIREVSN